MPFTGLKISCSVDACFGLFDGKCLFLSVLLEMLKIAVRFDFASLLPNSINSNGTGV